MSLEALLIWLIVGAVAGWLAGLIVKGYGFGLIGNIVVGIIGAVIAGWLLPKLGISLGGTIVRDIIDCHDRRRHLAGDHRAGQTLDRPAGLNRRRYGIGRMAPDPCRVSRLGESWAPAGFAGCTTAGRGRSSPLR